MATVKEHYEEVLSSVYSWMHGGFESGIQRNTGFINAHQLTPRGSGVAIDLGAGCGFQSIPLAKAGYSVTAIDLDSGLLKELKNNSATLEINRIQGDLIEFDKFVDNGIELIVCLTDTILHLESKEKVNSLVAKAFAALDPGGKFIITFRDLTEELTGLDRFLPVKSDENIIFTCFLEYEPETVKVHDIVYQMHGGEWHFSRNFYRKLRLSQKWLEQQLSQTGFNKIHSSAENDFITIIGTR